MVVVQWPRTPTAPVLVVSHRKDLQLDDSQSGRASVSLLVSCLLSRPTGVLLLDVILDMAGRRKTPRPRPPMEHTPRPCSWQQDMAADVRGV